MSIERRRSPRVEIVGRLEGRSRGLDATVRVRNFSLVGMAIETNRELAPGDVQSFDLTLGDGAIVELRGRVAHTRALAGPGEPPLFVSGIEFIDDPDADRNAPGPGDVLKQVARPPHETSD